jgi:hypothetical protein
MNWPPSQRSECEGDFDLLTGILAVPVDRALVCRLIILNLGFLMICELNVVFVWP